MSARKLRGKRAVRKDRRGREGTPSQPLSQGEQLRALWNWFLPDAAIFSGLALHGNTTWDALPLVWLALCWSWSECRNVTDAFNAARKQCRTLGIESLDTYQGMLPALVVWTKPLLVVLWRVLHQRMKEIGGRWWRIEGFVPIAFDGSRSTAPRTRSAEQAFCAPNYGKGATAKYRKKKSKGMRRTRNKQAVPQPQEPQLWITMLWHMGLRLPWMWRLGPSNSSERTHVMEMLDDGEFPENTLFCGDAGFVGCPLWSRILERGHHFLVRVGGNVRLLADFDCQKTRGGKVLCWPEAMRRAGLPPLRLRLVGVKIGRTKMWMLTSVLDSKRLSRAAIARFYEMRWGIEVEFRGLKQTLDRGRLRCRTGERLLVELDWSILAMAVAELLALKEQLAPDDTGPRRRKVRSEPRKRSLAQTVRVLRTCLDDLQGRPERGQDLRTRLRMAVTDDYHRTSSKKARYRPPNPDKKPLGDPKIRRPSNIERKKLRELRTHEIKA